ncbi:kinase-like domain-containing protein [Talaromyces proteolyticus]|uniref:Kinase-like domain-containing protein n=1 Tax=Talaromyces proteolyticus TaxID=1131652 RepID=A0AAD4PU17_9EURO|nr:kinase-like domain-containing protein [Talaromyces proteolyticus]KAH8688787.1 kinase-like domain-containing protein [Talaromyces proteolyticus]
MNPVQSFQDNPTFPSESSYYNHAEKRKRKHLTLLRGIAQAPGYSSIYLRQVPRCVHPSIHKYNCPQHKMAFQKEEKDQLALELTRALSHTPYICSSLTHLSGGTANFLFRGILTHPLADGTQTVVVKHSKEFVAVNRNFSLEVSRCLFEETMLNALDGLPNTTTENITIQTPHLYEFDRKQNTQILEDLSDTIDLKTVLVSAEAGVVLPQSISTAIGCAVGVWLRAFHSWTAQPAQANLRKEIAANEPMRKLRYQISYGAFIEIVQKFPEVWDEYGTILQQVQDMATEEYAQSIHDPGVEDWGVIHADFWAGNVLIPNTPSLEKRQAEGIDLYVIDWELSQFGRKEYDVGQMIGDLYERKHFLDVDSAIWAMQGFVAGYGPLDHAMAFRAAIHAGVHLICWYIRRNPTAPFLEDPKLIHGAIRTGTDFIVKAWEKDRVWFENSPLACLFASTT